MVAGCHYTTCAQLRFAARGRFEVRCPSPRRDQFDYFPGGDGSAPRAAPVDLLYVKDVLRFPFDADELYRCGAVTTLGTVEIRRAGRRVRAFALQRCRHYRGLRARRWPP